jgi:opacity protein-like surface antigen
MVDALHVSEATPVESDRFTSDTGLLGGDALAVNSKQGASVVLSDSAASPLLPEPQTWIATANEENREKEEARNWRFNVSYSPLFITTRAQPVKNDDVLITNVDNSRPLETVGFRFALGVGTAVSRNLYLDAGITFRQSEQHAYYSYSNGEVDTLIATQLPDQSVIVSPVYHLEQAEVKGRYSYAGVGLAATYYFWQKGRRRFSFTAGADVQYLLISSTSERVNGQWSKVSASPDKLSVGLTIGAGYNLMFGRNWELMVSPTLSAYLGSSNNNEPLPYTQSQSAIGLNLVLSRTLGKP